MIVKLVREGLGRVVLFFDWITRPKPLQRSAEEQQAVVKKLENMSLYQFYACPFCIKTRRALHRLNLPMQSRNVHKGSPYREELEQGGGRIQVPCLRMRHADEDVWMYESSDIIEYLTQEFGKVSSQTDVSC